MRYRSQTFHNTTKRIILGYVRISEQLNYQKGKICWHLEERLAYILSLLCHETNKIPKLKSLECRNLTPASYRNSSALDEISGLQNTLYVEKWLGCFPSNMVQVQHICVYIVLNRKNWSKWSQQRKYRVPVEFCLIQSEDIILVYFHVLRLNLQKICICLYQE